ncbi:unnamed protein product, partial [Closterium sp. NIES-53]
MWLLQEQWLLLPLLLLSQVPGHHPSTYSWQPCRCPTQAGTQASPPPAAAGEPPEAARGAPPTPALPPPPLATPPPPPPLLAAPWPLLLPLLTLDRVELVTPATFMSVTVAVREAVKVGSCGTVHPWNGGGGTTPEAEATER